MKKRGIVYMPFGAPTFDRYGGDRAGDNLFGTSLVAADARTGKYLWHFQVVHHDIWDGDLEAAPLLFDATVKGRKVPAVAVISKSALLFVLNRETGKPIFPIAERKVPISDVPGKRHRPPSRFRW
jgi:quinoprotein glucose dehydrogenase